MATRPDDFRRRGTVLLIEESSDERLLPVNEWLAALEGDEPVQLREPAAITLEQVRAEDEA